jgi:peptidoglycan/LPS O-acetylase OafA/YrhL
MHPDRKKAEHFAGLDLVRGGASCVVFAAHVMQLFLYPFLPKQSALPSITNHLAVFSVLVFFVLSGYLITGSLIQNYRRNGAINELQFLRARMQRILPPFLAAMVLTLMVVASVRSVGMPKLEPLTGAGVHVSIPLASRLEFMAVMPTALLSNGLIPRSSTIPANLALWSLSIEVWLYGIALLAAMILSGRDSRTGRYTATVALAMVLLCLAGNSRFYECAVYWALGAIFACMAYVEGLRKLFRLILIIVLAAGAIEAAIFWPKIWPLERYIAVLIPVKLAILIAGTVLFRSVSPFIPRIVLVMGRKLASSSYTLYILHFPVLIFLFALLWDEYAPLPMTNKLAVLIISSIAVWTACHAAAQYLENKARWERVISKLDKLALP